MTSSFFDEFEKLSSPLNKMRRGVNKVTPHLVTLAKNPYAQGAVLGGVGALGVRQVASDYRLGRQVRKAQEERMKMAESLNDKQREALRRVDTIRPFAYSALKGALPGGLLGGFVSPTPKGRLTGASIGAGIGVADRYLQNLSKERKFRSVLRNYQEKKATSGMDLRLKGESGMRRPPFGQRAP